MADFRLRTLAATYFRIGNTTFGGGDPTMIALRKELVDKRGVLLPGQFGLSYMLARVTPGTNILAFCAATGFQLRGWPGALLAVIAVAVPSSILAVAVTGAYQAWITSPFGAAAIEAMMAAAVGLMFAGAWVMVRPEVSRARIPRTACLLSLSFGLSWWAGFSPLETIGVAALAGALWRDPQ